MLESRSAYGWYGAAGGMTGENKPSDANTVAVNMSYWEYKHRYPECKNLGDYDKVKKTITVLLPVEVTERPNYGNRYQMHTFYFETDLDKKGFSKIFSVNAKNYKNAVRNAKAYAKRDGFIIIGDAKGHENQRNY